jgi:nucleoside phosphorylase
VVNIILLTGNAYGVKNGKKRTEEVVNIILLTGNAYGVKNGKKRTEEVVNIYAIDRQPRRG